MLVPSVVIPKGSLKLAEVPLSSVEPEDPVPANVVTDALSITILRIL